MASKPKGPQQVDAVVLNSLLTNALERALLGSLCFIPGCVLFRRPALRWLTTGVGIGFGLGTAWTEGDLWLRHPEMVTMPASLSDEMTRIKEWTTKQLSSFKGSE
mmetsp:Transcript_75515/g.179377  ORF Transcript_75515/g.179377 Transcript_75515/m.179377 type:complete len:105 (-) Transcript_75515:172-486(-)|eukprot:CAMPEP_0178428722 /NCGR_PEP_ID=MMETSP0689_2-20121128/30427_1 /TAXON_ID=160604 /ORGANISM="Amphidinium massartii, Strain CS-259" /LENGTH=104 /DNA_ID=CAMNT_0020050509 /DNA_START=17 /DNA_END=331 /DNA_ORIENTATION=-